MTRWTQDVQSKTKGLMSTLYRTILARNYFRNLDAVIIFYQSKI